MKQQECLPITFLYIFEFSVRFYFVLHRIKTLFPPEIYNVQCNNKVYEYAINPMHPYYSKDLFICPNISSKGTAILTQSKTTGAIRSQYFNPTESFFRFLYH